MQQQLKIEINNKTAKSKISLLLPVILYAFFACSLCYVNNACASEAIGWHWYNETVAVGVAAD